jgi:hypothetical protein
MAVYTAEADIPSRIEFAIFVGNATLARTEQTLQVAQIVHPLMFHQQRILRTNETATNFLPVSQLIV